MPGEQLLKALDHVWKALAPLNTPIAVMGGIAIAVWQHARSTRDVDILIQLAPADTPELIRVLGESGIHPRRSQPLLSLDQQHMLMMFFQPPGAFFDIKIDLLFAELEFQKQALVRRIPVTLPGVESNIFVLSCEDLILHKLLAGRIIDKADCAYLLRVNRQDMDFGYLQTWIERLSLMDKWLEIWRDVFPGEEPIITHTLP